MRIWLLSSIFCFALQSVGAAEEIDVLQNFHDWSAFKDDVSCWIASHPYNSESNEQNEEIYFFISFDYKVPSPSISVFYENAEIDTVELTLDLDRFELVGEGDTAYADKDEEALIFRNFLSASEIKLEGLTKGKTTRISSKGLREAYNFISDVCEFKKFRLLLSDGQVPA